MTAGALLLAPSAWLLCKDALGRRRLVLQNERWRRALLESFDEPGATLEETSPLLPHRTSGQTRGVRLTWALKPDGFTPFSILSLEMERDRGDGDQQREPFALSWRHGERAITAGDKRDPPFDFHDPNFERSFDYSGEHTRVLATLWHGARDLLLGVTTQSRFQARWFTVKGERLTAAWRIPKKEIDAPQVYALLRTAVELGVELCAPDPAITPSRLSSYTDENETSAGEHALELLFENHSQSAAAHRAARVLKKRPDPHELFILAMSAPQLLDDRQRELYAIVWAMRHHTSAARRRGALDATIARQFVGEAPVQSALEHLAIDEPDLELRAIAATHALRIGRHQRVDVASVLLAAQRLLKHSRELSPATRQRLELALIQTSAKPKLETYLRLARRSPDRILRYSSLRTLASRFNTHPDALAMIAERAHAEPLPWLARWCITTLSGAAMKDEEVASALEVIARDTSRELRTRVAAARATPLRSKNLLSRFIISQGLTLDERMLLARVLTDHDQGPRARRAWEQAIGLSRQPGRDRILRALGGASDLPWALDLLAAHVDAMSARAACAMLDAWREGDPFTPRALPFIERIAADFLDDSSRAVRKRAAALLSTVGSARIVPRLRAMHAREDARSVALRTQLETQRLHLLADVIKQIHARISHVDGALTLASEDESLGALTMTEARGALELLDE